MKPCLTILLMLALLSAAHADDPVTATFEVDSGRPIVQLTVNGKGPYPFVFDTGSRALLVMKSLANELGLEFVREDELQSPASGTPMRVDVVAIDSIALGGFATGELTAMVLDMGHQGLGMGIVGPVLFRDHGPMTIDFKNNTIVIGNDALPAEIDTWMPFGVSAPLLDAPVRIGNLVIDGHIDTGNPSVLSVPAEYETSLPLSGPIRTIGHARTVDAEFEIRGATIDASARIGDAEVPLRQILLSDLPVANLGTAGLRGTVLHIDWQGERFGLTGTAVTDTGPSLMRQRVVAGSGPRFGLMARPQPDGAIQVAGTEPGSTAEVIGLLAGDRIVAINGTPTGDLDHGRTRTELAREDLELTVERNGEEVVLKRH